MRFKYAFKVLATLQGMNEDDICKESFINIPVNMQLAAAARSTFKEALLMLAYVTKMLENRRMWQKHSSVYSSV